MTTKNAARQSANSLLALLPLAAAALSAGPAAAQTPSPVLRPELVQALTDTEWRTSTGHRLKASAQGDSFTLYGSFNNEAMASESVGLAVAGPMTLAGNWSVTRRGREAEHGRIVIQVDPGFLDGYIPIDRQNQRPWFACLSPPALNGPARWSGSWLWTRPISVQRDPAPGEAMTATVELQNVSGEQHNIDFSKVAASLQARDGESAVAGEWRDESGRVVTGTRILHRCDRRIFTLRFSSVPFETSKLDVRVGDLPVASFPSVAPAPTRPAPDTAPPQSPAPAPAPGPAPAPMPAPLPAPSAGGIALPAGASGYQAYGPGQFKVDQLLRGPDGDIQAVVSARNASEKRLPFSIADFDAYLIGEDGRTIRRLGNLYRLASAGPASALVLAGMSYLEPGDEIRARIVFPGTKDFQPAKLRLKEPVRSLTVNTYPLR
jgi:hypothetical protein